jgi:hypothetical protein
MNRGLRASCPEQSAPGKMPAPYTDRLRTCPRLGPALPAVPAYPSISAKFTLTSREQPASSIVTP